MSTASSGPSSPAPHSASLDEPYSARRHGSSEDAWDLLARVALAVGTLVFLAATVAYGVWLFLEAAD